MQIDYKRDLNHNYMIIREEGEPDAASYQIRMLQTNSITGILECRIHKMDNHTLFYYDITSRQSLSTVYEHQQVGCSFLKMLFQEIVKVLEELGSYLLDPEGLILTPNTVYLTAEPLQFSFCYLPGEKHSVNNQLRELMEYLLPKLNHQEPKTVVLGYGLYKAVTDEDCPLDQIRSVLLREPEVPVQEEPFAQEKQEAEEQKEGMRKKAMESFFTEEEEAEKESGIWTFAVILGGVAVLGLVLYLMYFTQVPAFMYLILLTVAGISILVISAWLRKKDREEAEKEMKPFLEGEKEIEPFLKKNQGESESPLFFHRVSVEEAREDRKASQEADDIFERCKEEGNHGSRAEECSCRRKPTVIQEKRTVLESERKPVSEQKPESLSEKERKLFFDQLLYQKTEPLYRRPRENRFRLVPVSHPNLPEIVISKEETTIGKLQTAADVVIPFPTVSRLHAKLHCAQGICLLTDLNSCNGTYVNEIPLEGDIPRKLEDGDEITFADIKYQFLER